MGNPNAESVNNEMKLIQKHYNRAITSLDRESKTRYQMKKCQGKVGKSDY